MKYLVAFSVGILLGRLYRTLADKSLTRHGRWEASTNGTDEWICSECGYVAETKPYKGIKPNHCPNCRKRMEGASDD